MRRVICANNAAISPNPLSQAIKVGDFIFVSGQLGKDPSTGKFVNGMAEQTRLCLENMKAILEAAGSSLKDVVKTLVFVTDLNEGKEMNEVYRLYFRNEPPARSCVEAKLATGALVEIEAVAFVENNKF